MADRQEHDLQARIAELQRANTSLEKIREEQSAALTAAQTREAALAEVLTAINASLGDPQSVFELILEKAHQLCGADIGALVRFDGTLFQLVVSRGYPESLLGMVRAPYGAAGFLRDLIAEIRTIHIPDLQATDPAGRGAITRGLIEIAHIRTYLIVPLHRDGALTGFVSAGRLDVRPFSASEVSLLESFAAQAVIAMENARLINEQREALEQQTATAEVLGVINASPGNLDPVFQTMLDRAMHLCGAAFGELHTYDGTRFHTVALHGVPEALAEHRRRYSLGSGAGSASRRMLDGEDVIHVPDLMAEEVYKRGDRSRRAIVDLGGARSAVAVAMRKEGRLLGVINIYRQETGPYSERQIGVLMNFASQAVIAMENARLLGELQERTEALALRNTEFGERLEQQSATIDVLKAMSASPGDPQPVFEMITRRAQELCNVRSAALFEFDGKFVDLRSLINKDIFTSGAVDNYKRLFPMLPSRGSITCRAILDRQIVHVRDLSSESDLLPSIRAAGHKSQISLPLMRDGSAIGAIALNSADTGGFSESQVALLQTFAEQAVIAITSAETYRALQARTADLQESLEYQTATADVLKVISRSTFDLQPVLDTMVEAAAGLCAADLGLLSLRDHDTYRVVATFSTSSDYEALIRDRELPPGRGSLTGRVVDARQIVEIADLATERAFAVTESVLVGKIHSAVGVPLLRAGEVIGVISLGRQRVQPFNQRQIDLVSTFADQAVIAIENTRLITEQREALEQQTATAAVLGVINASPGNLAPVFEAMLEKACRLCAADSGAFWLSEGEMVRGAAARGYSPMLHDYIMTPHRTDPDTGVGRILHNGLQVVHIPDISQGPAYLAGDRMHRLAVDVDGIRSVVAVPLRKDDAVLGVFGITRREARSFTEQQIAVLRNFAAQAVIAMENARLLDELRERTEALALRNSEFGERIEQQSATIDVLKVMSSSPEDPQSAFQLIAERANIFCAAEFCVVSLLQEGQIFLQAFAGVRDDDIGAYARMFPRPLDDTTAMGRAMRTQCVVEISDTQSDPQYGASQFAAWFRSLLSVPLVRSGKSIGAIGIARPQPGYYSKSQVELLQTFAEQAVIAITSAETYRALQDRTSALAKRNSEFGERIEQQSATIDVLKVMSSSPGDPQPVFDLIAQRARSFGQADAAAVTTLQGNLLHLEAFSGLVETAADAFRSAFPRLADNTTVQGRAVLSGDMVLVADLLDDPRFALKPVAQAASLRSLAAVPMLRGGQPIGAIALSRGEPGLFSDTQIELVRTFAEQAVIAMTSAENHRALQGRTEELTRSVSELHALEETIRAVNSSLDLDIVLATIISRAVQLSAADEGTIYEYDEAEGVFVPKAAHGMSADRVEALRQRRVRVGETHLGRSAAERRPIHVSDIQQDRALARDVADFLEGIHAVLAVPLLRDDKVIGGLVIRRRTAGDFGPSIPTLLQTFAGQSVLAIENARLFEQLAARGDEARRARVAAEAALEDLRKAQDRLVQTEKMASLGQLTAGIAHEIKNPLNFVNNFSDLSTELLDELNAAIAPLEAAADPKLRGEIDDLTATLKANLAKIAEHGRRADSIVKNMLAHSRTGGSERRSVDLNAIAEEALNLAYHGARAEFPGFNIILQRDLDPTAGEAELYPQEFTRVLLNLISNAFYATRKRAEKAEPGYEPTLRLSSRVLGDQVEITVRDNGTGIPEVVREKIFEPFFTTKPAGEGTGLGLSLSFDIIVKQHGGQLTVQSEPGNFTEFRIILPRRLPEAPVGGGGTT